MAITPCTVRQVMYGIFIHYQLYRTSNVRQVENFVFEELKHDCSDSSVIVCPFPHILTLLCVLQYFRS